MITITEYYTVAPSLKKVFAARTRKAALDYCGQHCISPDAVFKRTLILADTYEDIDQYDAANARLAALAKLTPEDLEALGLS